MCPGPSGVPRAERECPNRTGRSGGLSRRVTLSNRSGGGRKKNRTAVTGALLLFARPRGALGGQGGPAAPLENQAGARRRARGRSAPPTRGKGLRVGCLRALTPVENRGSPDLQGGAVVRTSLPEQSDLKSGNRLPVRPLCLLVLPALELRVGVRTALPEESDSWSGACMSLCP